MSKRENKARRKKYTITAIAPSHCYIHTETRYSVFAEIEYQSMTTFDWYGHIGVTHITQDHWKNSEVIKAVEGAKI